MKIPFMRIDRQFAALREEAMPKIMAVLETGRVLQSPEIDELEQRLARLHGLEHGVAVNSGTDALTLAIAGLGLPKGSAIAVTAMTFIASASAIVHNGCRPVFVDVDPETMLMDLEQTLDLVRKDAVKAVVAVHLYGQLLDLDELAKVAEARGVPLIEDGAQSLGSTRLGRPPGRHGRATCLSFDPTKVIGACGSGGALLTSDPEIAKVGRRLRYHGHAGNRVYDRIGYNWQMDSIQAAIIGVKLNHLEAWQARRAAIARTFSDGIAGASGIVPVRTLEGNVHNHHKFVMHVERRNELAKHLADRGVQTSVHYSLPLHRQPCFAEYGQGVSLPHVEKAAERILSLPMYAELSDEEVRHIVGAVREFSDA
jgi:dTDP-4-amino-4,6-dideoxygalactose transaminase